MGCDATDLHRLADFWAKALGYVAEPGYDQPDGASIIDPEGKAPAIGWLRVPEGKSAKNRLHIDIRVVGEGPWDTTSRERLIRAKVPELVAVGATVVREEHYEECLGHVVCLAPRFTEVHPCPVMSAMSARELCQFLAGAGVRCWVIGGWGIDALLGRETRTHKDIDVLLVRSEHTRAWKRLHAVGFTLDYTWEENKHINCGSGEGPTLPTAYMLVDREGRQVDVHVLDDGLAPLWTTDRTFIAGALEARGTIEGLDVACMSVQMQRIAHTGYLLPEAQRRDLELLDACG